MDGPILRSERRSPCTGLPIFSTEPLSRAERQALERLSRAHAHLQARLALALGTGLVADGLDALQALAELGRLAEAAAPLLGRGR